MQTTVYSQHFAQQVTIIIVVEVLGNYAGGSIRLGGIRLNQCTHAVSL